MPSLGPCRSMPVLLSLMVLGLLASASAGAFSNQHQRRLESFTRLHDKQLFLGDSLWMENQDTPPNTTKATRVVEPAARAATETVEISSVAALVPSLVTMFLLCGECVILGAALFTGMVHFTPGGGLYASKRCSQASLMAVLSAIGYHAVALGWYLGKLGALRVLCFAPVFQALLTLAIALLYTAVMDLYNRADYTTTNPHYSTQNYSYSHIDGYSRRRARWY